MTLGWVALVVLVALVGAPPPPPILSHSHSSRRDTGHTCFLSPWSRTAYSSGQHSDKRRQTQRRQEKEAILGCDQYVYTACQMQKAVNTGPGGQKVFSLFSNMDWFDLSVSPNQFFDTVSLLSLASQGQQVTIMKGGTILPTLTVQQGLPKVQLLADIKCLSAGVHNPL